MLKNLRNKYQPKQGTSATANITPKVRAYPCLAPQEEEKADHSEEGTHRRKGSFHIEELLIDEDSWQFENKAIKKTFTQPVRGRIRETAPFKIGNLEQGSPLNKINLNKANFWKDDAQMQQLTSMFKQDETSLDFSLQKNYIGGLDSSRIPSMQPVHQELKDSPSRQQQSIYSQPLASFSHAKLRYARSLDGRQDAPFNSHQEVIQETNIQDEESNSSLGHDSWIVIKDEEHISQINRGGQFKLPQMENMAASPTPCIKKSKATQIKYLSGDKDDSDTRIDFTQTFIESEKELSKEESGTCKTPQPQRDKYQLNLQRFERMTTYSIIQKLKQKKSQNFNNLSLTQIKREQLNEDTLKNKELREAQDQMRSVLEETKHNSRIEEQIKNLYCSAKKEESPEHLCSERLTNPLDLSTTGNGHKCSTTHQLAVTSCDLSYRQQFYKFPNLIKDPKGCLIVKQGWLKKKTTSLFLGWQDRYFVLYSNHKLIYYKQQQNPDTPGHNLVQQKTKNQVSQESNQDYTAADIEECLKKCGEYDFNIIFAKVFVEDQKKFKLQIKGSKRTFLMECHSQKELLSWVEHIQGSIFEGFRHSYTGSGERLLIASLKKFWKDSRLCSDDFEQIADSGDILLFRSQHFAAKFQRMITKSLFDHVAVILRYSDGRIYFLESSDPLGVSLVSWSQFRQRDCLNLYDKIVYRRLVMERSYDKMQKLEQLMKVTLVEPLYCVSMTLLQTVLSKKFKINASKIFRKKNSTDYNEQMKNNKTFFCSELVASVFKNLSLLPEDVSASQYWPVSFSQKKRIKLLNGAFLEEEKMLDLIL